MIVQRFAAMVLLLGISVAAAAVEPLSFQISYRGLFSAMNWWDIAHASYFETDVADDGGRRLAELHVSSERLAAIERLYPIRHLFRSVTDTRTGALAFERYRRGSRLHHRVFVVDENGHNLRRYRVDAAGPPFSPGWLLPADALEPAGDALALPGETVVYDQLTLIRAVRDLDWGESRHRLMATNGKRLLEYHATLEAVETLEWHGRSVRCWRIRVDGVRAAGEADAGEAHHGSVTLWVSADTDRLPIRAEYRHAIGRFRVALLPTGQVDARIVPSVVDQFEVADVGNRRRRLVERAVLE